MRSRRARTVWIFMGAAVVLVVVAAVAGAVYLVLRQQRNTPTTWQDPIAAVESAQVLPDPALYPLAGSSTVETVDAAIAIGALETAYATLAYDVDAQDGQRIGRLIELGSRYAAANGVDKASLIYQQIYELAVISPSLSDSVRADALLAAGKGSAALGKQDTQALAAYEQAYQIATMSPYLQRAERRRLLLLLQVAYSELGATAQAQACVEQVRALDQQPGSPPFVYSGQLPELPSGATVVSSPEIGALEETRRQAVFALLQPLSRGEQPAQDLLALVSQALTAEDAAKLSLYRQELESTTQSARRVDVHWQMIRWLLLKSQVATQGFGLSLVADWEAQLADIRSALTKEYEDLLFDYEDLVTALPDVSLLAPGRYRVLRVVTEAGQLGQYPNYPAEQMVDKLRQAVADIISAGSSAGLYVDASTHNGEVSFFLSPAEDYGRAQGTP